MFSSKLLPKKLTSKPAVTQICDRNEGKLISQNPLTGHSEGFGYTPSYIVQTDKEFHLLTEEI